MAPKTTACVSVALMIGVLTAACAVGDERRPGDGEGRPFAFYERTGDPGEGPGALLEGRLMLEDGCLYVLETHFGDRWLPAFPADAHWDEATRTLSLDGRSVTAGEEVRLGGGERKPAGAWDEQSDLGIPVACAWLWDELHERGEGVWMTTIIAQP